ncbi:MAG TPA: apolipoprotein N-acyltransferase [Jatrophihabitantaceae bacterium]|nr:apolipoprotein N-acyltransferase [Jatrophihabitantaceae bacterium]
MSAPPAAPVLGRVRWAALAAVVSGLIGVAAFPPNGVWPLAAVGVAGLSLAVHGRQARTGAWLGYLWGWAFFGPLLSWSGVYVGLVWLLLPFAEAAFIALLGAALTVLGRMRWAPLWTAAAWVTEEALRDRLPFGGFPWGRWAFSQADSPLRWFAPLGGAPLVTAAVALAGAGLAAAVIAAVHGRVPGLVLGAVVLVAVPLVGVALAVPLDPPKPSRTAVIALIQGDVPDRGLNFDARRRQVLDNHVNQTLRLAAEINAGRVPRPELVLWPENASDIDPFRNADARAQIERAVHAVGAPILVGAILDGADGNQRINAGILWSPTAGPGAEYVKRHPVPFGEYIPLRSLARKVSSKVDLVPVDMTRGKGNGLVRGGPMPIGDVICFEVAYDGLVRSSVRAGAQLVVVQTNNATFGHTAETYQQLAMSRLRAVESGRTLVQVATSGKSAVIDRSGRVMAESGPLFTPDVIVSSVPLSRSTTLATRLGAWPELALCLIAVGALAAAAVTTRRRRPEPPEDDAAPEPADEPATATR